MVKVTFTNNVDHYVRGETHELNKDEMTRIDAYIRKWNIKNAYVKGEATEEQLAVELPNPRKRGQAKRTQPAPKVEKPAKATEKPKVEDEPKEPVTPPADETDPATELPEDKGNPASEGEGENPEVETPAEGDDAGSPEVTGQGDTPKEATEKPKTETK